jgi:hypothetical protein
LANGNWIDQARPQFVCRHEEARECYGREAAQQTKYDRAWKLSASLLMRAEKVSHLALDQSGRGIGLRWRIGCWVTYLR